MEKDILEVIPEGKVYTTKTILVSSFFGGLLAGSFMLYQNFKTFGDHRKAGITIVISVAVLIFLLAVSFIPSLDKIPSIFYSIIVTAATAFFTKKYQEHLIDMHIVSEGKTYNSGRAILVCVISIAILIGLILVPFLIQDQLQHQ